MKNDSWAKWGRTPDPRCRVCLPAVKGGQAGKRKEQRMNLENAEWTGTLGSSYQLPGYLGMAEWTPEVKTQLKLSSCKCSVCGRKAASLIVHFSPRASFTASCFFPEKTLNFLLASLTSCFRGEFFLSFFFFSLQAENTAAFL